MSATSAQVITGGAFKKLISQTVISGSPSSVTITLPSGYSQLEITWQSIIGGSTGQATLQGATSSGGTTTFYGRGWFIYSTSSYNQGSLSSTIWYLTPAASHSAGQPFGGSLLLQSASSGSYWNFTLMTNYYASDYSYYSATGYFSNKPTTLTFSGLGTLSNGVISVYGIG